MKTLTIKEWIKKCQTAAPRKDMEVDQIKYLHLLKEAEKPSLNRKEAFVRLNLLMEAYDMNPPNGVFPTKEIMMDILEGLDFDIQEISPGRFVFTMSAFELELIPTRSVMEIRLADDRRIPNPMLKIWPQTFKNSCEYDIIRKMKECNLKPEYIATLLTELSIITGEIRPSEEEFAKRTAENLFALEHEGKADAICKTYFQQEEEMERNRLRIIVETENMFEVEIGIMKSSGLYDTLKYFEEACKLRVSCEFIKEWCGNEYGLKAIDAFLEIRKNKEKEPAVSK